MKGSPLNESHSGGRLSAMNTNIISFYTSCYDEVGCDKKQAFRFMGCKDNTENEELDRLYGECLKLVQKEASFKAVWRKSKLCFVGDDTVEFDFGRIRSASLCKNLEGCKEAYVFAATAGLGIDRLIVRYQHLDAAKAMVLSAVGSSAVECWCDKVNEKITAGKSSKPRFSPGYGGVELKHQREILDFLDATKRLGITLTDSFFMTPVKSVTAFIGIAEE